MAHRSRMDSGCDEGEPVVNGSCSTLVYSDLSDRRYTSCGHQLADRGAHIIWCIEPLLVEVDDVKLDGDELQTVGVRHHDAHRLSAEFYNLLLHDRLPHWLHSGSPVSNVILERKEPEALHSTARKGASIRAVHVKRRPAESGEAFVVRHVTLLLLALRAGLIRFGQPKRNISERSTSINEIFYKQNIFLLHDRRKAIL